MKFKFLATLFLSAVMSASAQGYQDGIEYYKADQFGNAKTILTRTLNNADTDKSMAYYYLGEIALRDGDKAGAKQNFDNGVAANAENPYNYIGLATLNLMSGDVKAAEANFKLAEKYGKKNNDVLVAIARAYYVADPVAYAEKIDKYIEKANKNSKNQEASVYILQGDMVAATNVGDAAGKYEMAVMFDPESPEGYVKYANVIFGVNPKAAIAKLEELLAKRPTSALAQRELAVKYYDNGQYAKASDLYGQYVQNPNHFQEDEERYTVLLFANGKFAEAFEYGSKCQKSFLIQRMLFWSKAAVKDYATAATYAEDFFATNEGAYFTTNDYAYYGDVLVELQQDSLALIQFEKAIALDTVKNTGLYERISKIYDNQGDTVNAAIAFEKYVNGKSQISPNDCLTLAKRFSECAKSANVDSVLRLQSIENGLKYVDLGLSKVTPQGKYMFLTWKVTLLNQKYSEINAEQVAVYKELATALEVDAATTQKQARLYNFVCSVLADDAEKQKDYASALTYYEKAYSVDPTNERLAKKIEELKKKMQ